MTIDELMDELQDARHQMGGHAEVRIAYQPAWPMRAAVARVTVPAEVDADRLYDEGERAAGQDEDGRMVWLAAGEAPYGENPYGPRWAWRGGEADR